MIKITLCRTLLLQHCGDDMNHRHAHSHYSTMTTMLMLLLLMMTKLVLLVISLSRQQWVLRSALLLLRRVRRRLYFYHSHTCHIDQRQAIWHTWGIWCYSSLPPEPRRCADRNDEKVVGKSERGRGHRIVGQVIQRRNEGRLGRRRSCQASRDRPSRQTRPARSTVGAAAGAGRVAWRVVCRRWFVVDATQRQVGRTLHRIC